MQLCVNGHGKPWLVGPDGGPSPLRFSLAHAPGALLLALSADGHLGCDVEPRGRASRGASDSTQRLARRYFSASETAALEALSDPAERRVRFMELWTLKEAYVKALGRGIAAAPLSTFSVALEGPAQRSISLQLAEGARHNVAAAGEGQQGEGGAASEGAADWRFCLLRLGAQGEPAHLAALCCAGTRQLQLRVWRTRLRVWEREADSVEVSLLAEGTSEAPRAAAAALL